MGWRLMPTFDKIFCECCGRSAEDVLIHMTFDHRGQTIRCETCERLVEEGILREETGEDGKRVYRRWQRTSTMTPTDHTWPAFSPVG